MNEKTIWLSCYRKCFLFLIALTFAFVTESVFYDFEDKTTIYFLKQCLKSHNELRSYHCAPLVKMDKALVRVATKRAKEMAVTDGDDFSHPPKGLLFGENIHWYPVKGISAVDCSEVCNDWYNEADNYDWTSLNELNKPDNTVGHFTQLIWKNTTRIGCATVNSKGPKGGAFTVCVYHPPGNIESIVDENVISKEQCNEDIKNETSYENLTNDTWNDQCLQIHNKLRKKHSAPPLVLDGKIIAFARRRAIDMAKRDYTNFGHKKSTAFAENLHWGKRKSGPSIRCEELVNLWYSEIKNYDWKERINHNGSYAHFTQIIWHTTKKLGCAQVFSKGIVGGTYTVCGYEPMGNIPTIEAHSNNVLKPIENHDHVSNKTQNLTISKRSVDSYTKQEEILNSFENVRDDCDNENNDDEDNVDDDFEIADEELPDTISDNETSVHSETDDEDSTISVEMTTVTILTTNVTKTKENETDISVAIKRKEKNIGKKSKAKHILPTRQFKQSKRKRKSHVRLPVSLPIPTTMSSTNNSSPKSSKFKLKPQTFKASVKNMTRSLSNVMLRLLPKISG